MQYNCILAIINILMHHTYTIFLLLSFLLKKHTWIMVGGFALISIIVLQYCLWHPFNTHANTFYHLISFATGIAGAKIVSGKSPPSIPIILGGIIITFLISAFFISNPQLNWYRKIPFSFLTGLIIVLIYQAQPFFKKVKAIFVVPELLGKYSYGFYIFSGFVIPIVGRLNLTQNMFLHIMIALSVTFVLAVISYHLIELPFIKLKDKFRFK